MERILNGKCAVITGASEGIGLETARLFLKNGAKVCICGRNEEKLHLAGQALQNAADAQDHIYISACDVSDSKRYEDFLAKAAREMNGLDILVNNAGYMPFARLDEMEERLWDQVIDTNLKSVFIGLKGATSLMKNGGVVINAASFAAVMPSVGLGAYAAAKAGVVALTRTAASELAPRGIRVVGYIPGVIDTALNAKNIAQNGENIKSPISLQRFGKPEDVARGLLFLASDAASYVTGTCLEISGGKFATQNPSAAWESV